MLYAAADLLEPHVPSHCTCLAYCCRHSGQSIGPHTHREREREREGERDRSAATALCWSALTKLCHHLPVALGSISSRSAFRSARHFRRSTASAWRPAKRAAAWTKSKQPQHKTHSQHTKHLCPDPASQRLVKMSKARSTTQFMAQSLLPQTAQTFEYVSGSRAWQSAQRKNMRLPLRCDGAGARSSEQLQMRTKHHSSYTLCCQAHQQGLAASAA